MNNETTTKFDEHKALADVVAFAISTAKGSMVMFPIIGVPVADEPCIGLWQTFKERFDLDLFTDKDLAINLFLATFKSTIATFHEA